MKRLTFFLAICFYFVSVSSGQSKANDITVDKLPAEVKAVLDRYVEILGSADLNTCAGKFTEIAGGGLVNENFPITLRSTVQNYSLKKDFDDIKFYENPVVITRVNVSSTNGNGFGATAIKGKIYKIWIGKKSGVAGMPAPVQILVPDGHDKIKTPKVTNIGSF